MTMRLVPFCYAAFGVSSAVTATLVAATWKRSQQRCAVSAEVRRLRRRYLVVYLLAFFADWMQGPYVYALYSAYGFSPRRIAWLFVVGFGSSGVVGTVVGGLADRVGRKACVLAYCVIYSGCCLCKHFDNLGACVVGRLLGGVATSLLFSTFEAWCVAAGRRAGADDGALADLFALAQFGNGVVAIAAGQVADLVARRGPPLRRVRGALFYGGDVWPFDVSAAALASCGCACCVLWEENYGDVGAGEAAKWRRAGRQVLGDARVLLCCCASATFESAMYVFVFLWTPELAAGGELPPEGLVFSAFMVAVMAGSRLARLGNDGAPEGEGRGARRFAANALVAAVALAVPAACPGSPRRTLVAFLAFEVCVGTYYPTMAALKSTFVSEDARASVYSIYRVPLNAAVVAVLLADAPRRTQWCVAVGLLAASALAGLGLARCGPPPDPGALEARLTDDGRYLAINDDDGGEAVS